MVTLNFLILLNKAFLFVIQMHIYLVMQLLEEVDFILQGLHLPLKVQSGEGSIVHILHGHIDS